MLESHARTYDLDDATDFIAENGQKAEDGHRENRVGFCGIEQTYRDGCLALVFHVKGRRVNGERHDFAAIYKAADEQGWERWRVTVGNAHIGKLNAFWGGHGQFEKFVFVRIVEVSEDGERGAVYSVPSIVRLYPLDLCPHCLGNGSAGEIPVPLSKLRRMIDDRKLQVSRMWWGILAALFKCDAVNKVVECAAKIMDAVSTNKGPSTKAWKCLDVHGEAVFPPFNIAMLEGRIRVRILPGADFITDGFGVFFCAPDLQPITGKFGSGHGVHLHG